MITGASPSQRAPVPEGVPRRRGTGPRALLRLRRVHGRRVHAALGPRAARVLTALQQAPQGTSLKQSRDDEALDYM